MVCNCCVDVCPVHCLTMETGYYSCMTIPEGKDTIQIACVKPERPPRKEKEEEQAG